MTSAFRTFSNPQNSFPSYGFSELPQHQIPHNFPSDAKFVDFLKTLPKAILDKVNLDDIHILFIKLSSLLASKEPFKIDFGTLDIKEEFKLPIVVAIIDSLKATLDKRLILKVIYPPKIDFEDFQLHKEIGYFDNRQESDFEETYKYFSLTSSTVGEFFESLLNPSKSAEEAYESDSDLTTNESQKIKSIEFSFAPLQKNGAFYPYLNESSYDLSQYGIFKEFNIDNYKDNCFIAAMKASEQFSEGELEYARSIVRTRILRFGDLKEICKAIDFNLNITSFQEDTSKSFLDTIAVGSNGLTSKRTVNMIRFRNHYFIDHKKPFRDNKGKLIASNIVDLVKKLHEEGKLKEIPLEQQAQILMTPYWNPPNGLSLPLERYCRKKTFTEKNQRSEAVRFKIVLENSTYNPLFQTTLKGDSLRQLYEELDYLLNYHLKLKSINTTNHILYSTLMQEIMFKTHCFDRVYECSYPLSQKIKSQLVFPKPHTKDDKPFYSKDHLYYLDLNGAYMSVIDGIPMGIPKENVEDETEKDLNKNIAKLIRMLYFERKNNSWSEPIIKALKQIMNSCWGYSISNPQVVSSCRPSNLDDYLKKHTEFIVSYDKNRVKEINPVVTNYTYPQFARRVLYNYHKKMNHVKSLVNVLYENIDAILVSEEDYLKLDHEGLIGDELGQFKIEHEFKEIAIAGPRQIMAIEKDGTLYQRGNSKESFVDFKNRVIESL